MIYEGNLVTTPEEIEGKHFLAPDGVTVSTTPEIGWEIVDPLQPYESYANGVRTMNTTKKKSDALTALVAKYKPIYAECDAVWTAKIARGLAAQADYTAARTAIVNEFKARKEAINNG